MCDTEIVLVRPPSEPGDLACGGAAMIPHAQARPEGGAPAAGQDGGSGLGKRYTDEATGLEALCTKPGGGGLSFAGRALTIKEAKRLPSSD